MMRFLDHDHCGGECCVEGTKGKEDRRIEEGEKVVCMRGGETEVQEKREI
jgi:hypothetical protein